MNNYDDEITRGEQFFNAGEIDKAQDIFQEILKSDPNHCKAMNNLGTIFYLKGEISEAENCFLKSYSIKDDDNDVLINITDLYINEKKWDKAIPFLEKYINNNNNDYDMINLLATTSMELGRTEKAISLLKQSLQIQSDQDSIKEVLETLESSIQNIEPPEKKTKPELKKKTADNLRFSVCMIEPEGRKHAHFLHDLGKYVCYTFEAAGYDCCIVKNQIFSDRINIIIGGHHLDTYQKVEEIASAGKYVVIQSEMLGDDTINNWPVQERYSEVYLPLLKKGAVIWEGQEENRSRLIKMGINPVFTQFGYLPQLEEIAHKKNKDIDFLYYGSVTPHRKKMLDALAEKGGKIYIDFDSTAIFRNDLIARTRVNLAPVQSPELNHLTGTRVLYLVNNKSIVVVERCKDQAYVENCFPSANTDDWADLCMEILNRPDLDQITQEYYERFKKVDLAYQINRVVERLL